MRNALMASALMAFALFLASASVSAQQTENKWRLEFSGNAESAGQVVLALAPEGDAAVVVTVPVAEDTRENDIASAVANQLRLQLGDTYQVERDDGEDVLVKRRDGEKKFSVGLVENTVEGLSLDLARE
ncbi:hypothetical protein N792_09290 [Lysobacter concretionis Ko07 = DSM 16239]|jgi:hypothetical protein|uniref:Uncharacterized protein n=1 Tax=Lysobacter concretionis Ko07 = DSM 16239 TaxID=1122185 RepID=A0A0A0ENY4_9GAMM|nr:MULTISPECIES: hypothetical protein [Lysobacter]KGM51828.1 hypothetical protein N792_09290 [Lysobacter concretionis Ko07 = DSM 16239]QOD92097.1 hypothetical protein H2514_05610 [Lysobacter sp. CW239]